jgi:hypothetical protein
MGYSYMAELNSTFIDLSSGEKIYGDAFVWGRTDTHLPLPEGEELKEIIYFNQ